MEEKIKSLQERLNRYNYEYHVLMHRLFRTVNLINYSVN